MNAFLGIEQPIIIAHRGGTEFALENTLAAFQTAGIFTKWQETDIQRSRDDKLWAVHGVNAEGQEADEGVGYIRIGEELREVAAMDEADRKALARAGLSVPLLDELLDTQHFPDMKWNIDAKDPRSVEPFIATLHKHRAFGRTAMASFQEATIRELRYQAPPEAATALAKEELFSLYGALNGWGGSPEDVPGNCVQVPETYELDGNLIPVVTAGFIKACHDLGKKVHVWTINSPDKMHELLDIGVDGVFTDRPSIASEVWQSRGLDT